VELYEVSVRLTAAMKKAAANPEDILDAGGWSSWLDWNSWLPKAGVFGIVLVGVVLWNVRKWTTTPTFDENDEEFKELLRDSIRKAEEEDAAKKGGRG